jgi:murein DD-endopeptidase MepM/ murein hydrolase activator NlpD
MKLKFTIALLSILFFVSPLIAEPTKKTPELPKKEIVLDLIKSREAELNNKISDYQSLFDEGLITLGEIEPFKYELRELEQFEFIVKNPGRGGYESALKEKLTNRVDNLEQEIKLKETLAEDGLVAEKDLETLENKAALYNYILSFINHGLVISAESLKKGSLASSVIFGFTVPLSSKFGFRTDPITPGRKQFHTGLDFAANYATAVKAPFDGQVSRVVLSTNSGGGRQVKLYHPAGFETVYMHLSQVLVKKGDIVKKGQIIGRVGATGYRVTGPHLHFELRIKGIPVDPMKYF